MVAPQKALLVGGSAGAGVVIMAKLAELAALLANSPPHQEVRRKRMVSRVKFKFHPLEVKRVTLMT